MCCGDGVCDGPETSASCAADCDGEEQEPEQPGDGGSRCGGEVVTLEVDGVARCYSVGYAPPTPAARVLVAFHGSGGSALACGRDTSDTGMVGASQAVGDLVSVCVAAVAGQWDTAAMEVNPTNLSLSPCFLFATASLKERDTPSPLSNSLTRRR